MLSLLLAALLPTGVGGAAPKPLPTTPEADRPPNVVIVFVDDMAWGDIALQGATGYATPNLDRMAAEGVRLTRFYVAQPVCSASRAALLTGCYPNRIGIRGALGPSSKITLHHDETTLAEVCGAAGHATAIFGKWHLGQRGDALPMGHGFDEYYGIPYSNDMWPYHPENPKAWGDLPTFEQDEVVGLNTDQARFTGEFTRRAVDFIHRQADADRRFFLYVPHPMPHVPLFRSPAFADTTARGVFGDVISEIDWSVGRILAAIDDRGLTEDTLVIFSSDNGPWLSYGDHAGSTGGLREGKGTTFEGGVRVPFIARMPGTLPAGEVRESPAMTIDVLPTIAELVDQPLPDQKIDGRSMWRLLVDGDVAGSPQPHYAFYYHDNELEAVMAGRFKLHLPHRYRTMDGREPGSGGIPGKYRQERIEGALYDLEADPAESVDVSARYPNARAQLETIADGYRAELGDRLTGVEGAARRAPGRID